MNKIQIEVLKQALKQNPETLWWLPDSWTGHKVSHIENDVVYLIGGDEYDLNSPKQSIYAYHITKAIIKKPKPSEASLSLNDWNDVGGFWRE